MSGVKIRACSFLPAVTSIINDLGLADHLVGVTFECDSALPKVVRSALEGNQLGSAEIDRVVSEYARDGRDLYSIDQALLEQLAPDIIFTQDVCPVCQIDTETVIASAAKLKSQPTIFPLLPRTLSDVFTNITDIAAALGHPERGVQLVSQLQNRIESITTRLRESSAPIRRVMLIEWLDPVYNCGHWIPEQVLLAGAEDALGSFGGYSSAISWDRIADYDPEIIVAAPCGFDIARTGRELAELLERPEWRSLSAVKSGSVSIADGAYFTQPSARLVDGIELLASIFHSTIFDGPAEK